MKARALQLLPLLATALVVVLVHNLLAAHRSLLTELCLVLLLGGGAHRLVVHWMDRRHDG